MSTARSSRREARKAPSNAVISCAHCGDVIGVYEPLMLVHDGVALATSLASDPDAPQRRGDRYHRECYVGLMFVVVAGLLESLGNQ